MTIQKMATATCPLPGRHVEAPAGNGLLLTERRARHLDRAQLELDGGVRDQIGMCGIEVGNRRGRFRRAAGGGAAPGLTAAHDFPPPDGTI
jgi:hypothetical protein